MKSLALNIFELTKCGLFIRQLLYKEANWVTTEVWFKFCGVRQHCPLQVFRIFPVDKVPEHQEKLKKFLNCN